MNSKRTTTTTDTLTLRGRYFGFRVEIENGRFRCVHLERDAHAVGSLPSAWKSQVIIKNEDALRELVDVGRRLLDDIAAVKQERENP